jgi:hypothetical protein
MGGKNSTWTSSRWAERKEKKNKNKNKNNNNTNNNRNKNNNKKRSKNNKSPNVVEGFKGCGVTIESYGKVEILYINVDNF